MIFFFRILFWWNDAKDKAWREGLSHCHSGITVLHRERGQHHNVRMNLFRLKPWKQRCQRTLKSLWRSNNKYWMPHNSNTRHEEPFSEMEWALDRGFPGNHKFESHQQLGFTTKHSSRDFPLKQCLWVCKRENKANRERERVSEVKHEGKIKML